MRAEGQERTGSLGVTGTRGVALTILAISATLLMFIIYAGSEMNRSARANERAMIDNALTEAVNRVLMEQKAWAFWDEAADRMRAASNEGAWFATQVGAPLVEGYGHESIYLISPQDRILFLYDQSGATRAVRLAPLWPALEPMLRQIRTGEQRPYRARDYAFALNQQRYGHLMGARRGRWAANILRDQRGPIIVSMMTVMPLKRRDLLLEKPAVLVNVRRIDEAMLHLIGESLQIPHLRLAPKAPAEPDQGMALMTDDGRYAGTLTWDEARPGEAMFTRILPILALLLLLALGYSRHIFRKLAAANERLSEQEASARFLALHDGLSQLPNRRHFNQALRERLDVAAQTQDGRRVCVAYLDVDRFKEINDAIGHGAGDAIVMQIGPRLRQLLRPDDLLARLGGDEFAILRVMDESEGSVPLGETILAAFKHPFEVEGTPIEASASAGIAIAERGERDPQRVLQQADISLYKAKDAGRNRYVLFESSMAEEVRARHAMETDLRAAIGTNQISIHYQPLVSTRTGKVTAVEALARWRHPRHGFISPQDFIPIAEQSGLMVPLGDHILEQIFREANRFPGIEIALNLSPVQLRQRQLPHRLGQLARLFEVDPRRIVLEITESLLVEANQATTTTFSELRRLGFRTALDDFGTGYSSLSYLHRFDFDKIKIDRCFVSGSATAQLRPIIEGIVHIGRGLRMDIVAEGVENAAEMAMVQAMGCTEVQGYYISCPLPIEEAVAFVTAPPGDEEPAPFLSLAS